MPGRGAWLLVLLVGSTILLASLAGVAWAMPTQSPARQTVPTRSPTPGLSRPPTQAPASRATGIPQTISPTEVQDAQPSSLPTSTLAAAATSVGATPTRAQQEAAATGIVSPTQAAVSSPTLVEPAPPWAGTEATVRLPDVPGSLPTSSAARSEVSGARTLRVHKEDVSGRRPWLPWALVLPVASIVLAALLVRRARR